MSKTILGAILVTAFLVPSVLGQPGGTGPGNGTVQVGGPDELGNSGSSQRPVPRSSLDYLNKNVEHWQEFVTKNSPAITRAIEYMRKNAQLGPTGTTSGAMQILTGANPPVKGQDLVKAFNIVAALSGRIDLVHKPGSAPTPVKPPPQLGGGSQPTLSQGTQPRANGGPTDAGNAPANTGAGQNGGDPASQQIWGLTGELIQNDLNNGSKDPNALGAAGIYAGQNGEYQKAYDLTKEAIDAGNKDPNVIVTYGASAYQLGDKDTAHEAGLMALGVDPENEAARRLTALSADKLSNVSLSSVLGKMGARGTSGSLGSARDAAPGGTKFFGAGGARTAAEIQAIAKRQSQIPEAAVNQSAGLAHEAYADLNVKDYQAAYNIASKAIDLNPANAQAWNYRAIADTRLQKFDDAVHDASFALGLAPNSAGALETRSWAFSKQGKYKEALADANTALERDPNNSYAYQSQAYALAGMGDRDAALAALRRSAELNPVLKPKYDRAAALPEASDLMFLFDDAPAAKAGTAPDAQAAAAPLSPQDTRRRFLRLFLLCLSGGALVALGLLHTVSASWRERVQTTIRRFTGARLPAGVCDEAGAAPAGFWAQYEVLRQIGTGGMGVVYEAKDASLGRSVAIKKMREEIRTDPAERQRFISEARTVAALHHPNIVDIYSIVEDGQDVYLVFEFVSGKTLAELLRDKGPQDFDSSLKLLRGICEAVDYAHRQKVVHRDIKASNIMLSDEGRVKVMDFGVARQAKDALTKLSMTNTVVGTPPYMAPEQEQGTVRKESDVFSLGVVFYELLSGKLPFNGQGAGMLLNKINGRHNPLSRQIPCAFPQGLDDVIAKALAPDPEKRYRTPSEFLSAVEAVAAARS